MEYKCKGCSASAKVFGTGENYCFLGFPTEMETECPKPRNSAELFGYYEVKASARNNEC